MSAIYYLKFGNLNFGTKVILCDTEFYIHNGDKICLVGRNGCGKSSLMKVISGEYSVDSGEVFSAPNIKTGYLKQEMQTDLSITIYDFILKQFEDPIINRYLADIILDKLELDGKKSLLSCSGGQIRRAHLCKVLVQQPNILLLDEPTNHLDIKTIEWLENYVKSYSGAVICISHDRAFLSNVTNRIWWLDRGLLRKSEKGFKNFDEWQELTLSHEESLYKKLNKKLNEENQWLNAGVTARRKRNQKRLSDLISLRQTIKSHSQKLSSAKSKLEVELLKEVSKTNFIIEADSLSFGYANKQIIDNFSFKVKKGEKIGIIGANGTGKSTFLSLLTKKLYPISGKISYGTNLEISEIDQYRSELNLDDTILKTLCPAGGDQIFKGNNSIHVAGYLKKFMFDPKTLNYKISTLSGGEANRLLLAKILINPGNLLILDEPTNDLDMDTLELLLEILADYKGTLIVVSHDRDFLNRLVTRSLIFIENKIIDIVGGYEDYERLSNNEQSQVKTTLTNHPVKLPVTKTVSSIFKKKLSYNQQRLLETLPAEIEILEERVRFIEKKLSDNNFYNNNSTEFNILIDELKIAKEKIDQMTIQWVEIDQIK